ncbi:hypothetical protein BDN70DRAFT_946902, partial [Pholiota conissans]
MTFLNEKERNGIQMTSKKGIDLQKRVQRDKLGTNAECTSILNKLRDIAGVNRLLRLSSCRVRILSSIGYGVGGGGGIVCGFIDSNVDSGIIDRDVVLPLAKRVGDISGDIFDIVCGRFGESGVDNGIIRGGSGVGGGIGGVSILPLAKSVGDGGNSLVVGGSINSGGGVVSNNVRRGGIDVVRGSGVGSSVVSDIVLSLVLFGRLGFAVRDAGVLLVVSRVLQCRRSVGEVVGPPSETAGTGTRGEAAGAGGHGLAECAGRKEEGGEDEDGGELGEH